MANRSTTAPGGPSVISNYRIVLLGKSGAGKSTVAKAFLGEEKLKEGNEECVKYEFEKLGMSFCIVDTPGWDKHSIDSTPEKIQNELIKSATLCLPGPHTLILVLPIQPDNLPTVNELKAASQHMELLSDRVWKYTMVLFLCDQDVAESTIKGHIQNAENILKKCSYRHYILRREHSEIQIPELLKKIDDIVEGNCGDCYLPQVCYDVMSKIMHNEDTQGQRDKKQDQEKRGLNQRRGSLETPDVNFTQEAGSQLHSTVPTKPNNQDEFFPVPLRYLKAVGVVLLAVIGALIGSVSGAEYGTVGAGVGMFIGVVPALLIALLIYFICTKLFS